MSRGTHGAVADVSYALGAGVVALPLLWIMFRVGRHWPSGVLFVALVAYVLTAIAVWTVVARGCRKARTRWQYRGRRS